MWKSTIEGQKLYCSCYYYPQNYKYRSDTKYRILTTHPLISSSIACVWNGFLLFFVPHFWQNCCFLRLMRSVANSLEHTTHNSTESSVVLKRGAGPKGWWLMRPNITSTPVFHCVLLTKIPITSRKKKKKKEKRESLLVTTYKVPTPRT